jgi:hypothetical protein
MEPYYAGEQAAADVSEVVAAEMKLAEVIANVHEIIAELERRLEHVLRYPMPQSIQVGEEDLHKVTMVKLDTAPGSAPITDFLVAQRMQLESAFSRLRELSGRLAV